jgi:hypothetical protein
MFCSSLNGQTYKYTNKLDEFGVTLPQIENYSLESKLRDKDTVFYQLPKVWQQYIPGSKIEVKNLKSGQVSYTQTETVWGIYSSSYLSEFNANLDFPWDGTVGLNTKVDRKTSVINFLILPKEDGITVPVLLIYKKPITWIFPVKTIIGEMIVTEYEGKNWVQEIRCREKQDGAFYWTPMVFRPVASKDELVKRIKRDYLSSSKYMFFRNPEEDEVFRLEGLVEKLPDLKPEVVKQLLSLPFKDVTEEVWSEKSIAPTSDQDFNLVPKDYNFGLIQPDQDNCLNCHRQTQISVSNLIPNEPIIRNNPDKVGSIRGSDSVFSWHPFGPTSYQNSKIEESEIKVRFRNYDFEKNIIALWEPNKSTSIDFNKYKLTEFVQSSLQKYQLPPYQVLHDERKAE